AASAAPSPLSFMASASGWPSRKTYCFWPTVSAAAGCQPLRAYTPSGPGASVGVFGAGAWINRAAVSRYAVIVEPQGVQEPTCIVQYAGEWNNRYLAARFFNS